MDYWITFDREYYYGITYFHLYNVLNVCQDMHRLYIKQSLSKRVILLQLDFFYFPLARVTELYVGSYLTWASEMVYCHVTFKAEV